MPEKRGAKKAKQNACPEPSRRACPERSRRACPERSRRAGKHSFYSKVLDQAEAVELEEALDVEGVSDEIALLRVKIQSLLGNDPENIKLILEATNTLARLVRTRYNLEKEQGKGLKEAIGNVLKDIALPLGIGIGVTLNR